MLRCEANNQVHFGEGAIAEVGAILQRLGARRVFFVIDRDAFRLSGAAAALEGELGKREFTTFDRFTPNPKVEEIVAAVAEMRRCEPNAVLAVGGGSALDVAKVASILSVQEFSPQQLIDNNIDYRRDGPPLIAVPTTAGTGSETTHFAAVYDKGVKFSVAHEFILPEFAVVDPELTYSQPPRLTAATGLDALCHAIESFWALGANEASTVYASRAIELAVANLEAAVNSPTPAARRAMSEAALLAGKAINISKTTASHALSYTLTTKYGVPHGMAVALTIAPLLVFNSGVTQHDCADPRGPQYVLDRIEALLAVLECTSAEEAADKINRLLRASACPVRLSEVGVEAPEQLASLASSVNSERLGNNPRRMDDSTIEHLLQQIG